MDIYDILSEARSGSVEKATKDLIEFMSGEIADHIGLLSEVPALARNGELYTDEDLKRIAIVDFIVNFIREHKAEIESNYNLLPLTNDQVIMNNISVIRNKEVLDVNDKVVDRARPKIEARIKTIASSEVDAKLDGYIKDLTTDVQEDETKVAQNPSDLEAKHDLTRDKGYLSVLKGFDQNRAGLKEGVANATVEYTKHIVDGNLLDGFDTKELMAKDESKVKFSVEDVQQVLEGNPIWAQITTKVPSDEVYDLMGQVIARKNGQTR